MFKYILGLAIAFISFQTFSQEIKYKLKMERPQSHYYEVEMELTDFTEKELSIKMPIWSPGSYLAREFAKNVDLVKAFDEKGKVLAVKKVSKNEWKISKGDVKKITVKYEVYAFELTVRTSFLDLTHGFVSGPSVFMYVDGHKDLAGSIDIYKYSGFKVITTALKKAPDGVSGDGATKYVFDNYETFQVLSIIESPIVSIDGQVIGVLELMNIRDPDNDELIQFTSQHEAMIKAYCRIAAAAIDRLT